MAASSGGHLPLLVESASRLTGVRSIGRSGGSALPEDGGGDVDLFVFCDAIPADEERRAMVTALGDMVAGAVIADRHSRHWGTCDSATVDAAPVYLMYFTTEEVESEVEAVLRGERLEREDNYFYPTGRCATLESMHILLDTRGFIASMKETLAEYPPELAGKLVDHHIRELDDVEDLERAVARADVLFHHFALDGAVDHFLQALFAMNGRYFPSRKRSLGYLDAFTLKPQRCAERLLRTVELGGRPETLARSYETWSSLCADLADLARGFLSRP